MKDIGLTTAARFIVIACQLINIKLYSNYLNAEQLGFYYLLLTISYFGNALIFGPLDYYQQANLRKIIDTSGGIRPLLDINKKILLQYLSLTIAILVVCFFVAKNQMAAIALTALLAILLYLVQTFRNALNNLGYRQDMSISLVLEAILKIGVFYLFVKLMQPDEIMLMLAWIFSLACAALLLLYRAHIYGLYNITNAYKIDVKKVFEFSYPISISAICNWIQLQGYRLVLVPLGYVELVGIFATISGIGSAGMSAVSTIFGQMYSPRIYSSNGKYTNKYLKNAFLLIVSICIFCIFFGEIVVQLATKEEFARYWSLMTYGVLMEGSNLIIGALAIHITLTGHTKKIMNSAAFGVIALVIALLPLLLLNYINIYTIGLPLIVSQLTVVTYMYWKFKNE
jgi:O-antigen/teichoic acid export membrane protein